MKKTIYGILFFLSFIALFCILGSYEQNIITWKAFALFTVISLLIAGISAWKLEMITIPND